MCVPLSHTNSFPPNYLFLNTVAKSFHPRSRAAPAHVPASYATALGMQMGAMATSRVADAQTTQRCASAGASDVEMVASKGSGVHAAVEVVDSATQCEGMWGHPHIGSRVVPTSFLLLLLD